MEQNAELKRAEEGIRKKIASEYYDVQLVDLMALIDCLLNQGRDGEAEDVRLAGQTLASRRAITKELEKLEVEYESKVDAAKSAIAALAKKCPHPFTKYYPDASGNNDSTTECLTCGKNL